MTDFKKWISYLYAYSGEIKGTNVGFARVEVRDGRCRLTIGIKGAYGCDSGGLNVGLYVRREGTPQRISIGNMRICDGCGDYEAVTGATDLFGRKITWQEWGGLWLTSPDRDMIYLASWEKSGLDAREFLQATDVKAQEEQRVQGEKPLEEATVILEARPHRQNMQVQEKVCPQEPTLWDSLSRYYPQIWPEWQQRGVEMLQIRPADIRYLPRRLWYYGSNSFLLHGYYQYKHLMLGYIKGEDSYLLGVPGRRDPRESYSAGMFGFHHFLPVEEQEGYWYTKIRL